MYKKSKAIFAALAIGSLTVSAQGFKIQNGNLVDANCNNFVIKGVNVPLAWFQNDVLNNIANIRNNTNSNCLRLVVGNGYTPLGGSGSNWSTPDNVWQQATERCIQNNMVPMLEIHNILGSNNPQDLQAVANWWATKSTYLTQPTIAKHVLINIANEWGDWFMSSPNHSPAQTVWRDAYIAAIQTIRNAGIKSTLVVDAPGYGQDNRASTLLNHALAVLNADPEKNVLFSLHTYCEWSIGGPSNPATLFSQLKNAGIPFIIGEFAADHPDGSGGTCDIDENLIINTCNNLGIGWLGWSWRGNSQGLESLDMSLNWQGTQFTPWGERAFNGQNGTKTSSVASVFTSSNSTCSDDGDNGGGGVVNPPVLADNILKNNEFDDGTTFWQLQNTSPGNGTMTVVQNENLSGANALKVCPTNAGTANWHIQLMQDAPFQAGKTYELSFMGKADANRPLGFGFQEEGGNWTVHYSNEVNLSTEVQTFSFDFNPTVSDATAKLKFYIGNNNACVYIDRVVFRDANPLVATISTSGALNFCEGGNVVLNANTGTDLIYQWRKNGNNIPDARQSSYTATESGSFTVQVTQGSNSVVSNAVSVTVNSLPTAPTVSTPVNYCQNHTASPLTANGTNLKWYANPSGGTALTNAPSPNTTVVGSTSYFVSQTNANNCEGPRALILVNIEEPTTWFDDSDGDGFGDPRLTVQSCTQPVGYVGNSLDQCPTDANKANPGECGCNLTETSCLDCSGIPNGTAFIDSCNVCAGGETGLVPVTDKNNCVNSLWTSNAHNEWVVSPNPFQKSTMLIKNGSKARFQVFDAKGLLVMQGEAISSMEIGEALNSGLYLIVLIEDGKKSMIRVIKE